MLQVNIISTESIKPASPTPPHLRVFNLSLLDQLVGYFFVTIVYYYPCQKWGPISTSELTRRLKTSLSQSLVHFYPLAGRLANDNWVDCNDQGVEFHESRVHCQLQDLLHAMPPDDQAMSQLVPCHRTCTKSGRDDVLLAIQANFFECGGLALAVGLSHVIGDCSTFVTFLNNWASIAREPNNFLAHRPPLISSQAPLFPPMPGPPRRKLPPMPNPVMKRFVLSQSNIIALKRKRSSPGRAGLPTQVEAVSALVCRCMTRATTQVGGTSDSREERVIVVKFAVNLRQRMDPPLQDSTFGNLAIMVNTTGMAESELFEDMQSCLEAQLRTAIKKTDKEFIRELQGPSRYAKSGEAMTLMEAPAGKKIELFIISSWCRFPVYQVDFGWGEPACASPAWAPVENTCFLMDRRGGDGIEIWVNMDGKDMAKFERDEELLAFVSPPTTTC